MGTNNYEVLYCNTCSCDKTYLLCDETAVVKDNWIADLGTIGSVFRLDFEMKMTATKSNWNTVLKVADHNNNAAHCNDRYPAFFSVSNQWKVRWYMCVNNVKNKFADIPVPENEWIRIISENVQVGNDYYMVVQAGDTTIYNELNNNIARVHTTNRRFLFSPKRL